MQNADAAGDIRGVEWWRGTGTDTYSNMTIAGSPRGRNRMPLLSLKPTGQGVLFGIRLSPLKAACQCPGYMWGA